MVNPATANSVYLIPLFPLLAFVVNILFGRFVKKAAGFISVIASALSFIIAVPVLLRAAHGEVLQNSFHWLALGQKTIDFGYLIDPLSATLLFVVTFIGTLIQIYSIGYMHGETRFSRFFAYVSLFMFGMLTLVISNNFLMFFMAWEIMGLCSYLLIGFYFEKDSAANASKKAFLTTRVGDIGLFLGLLTLFAATGTLSFGEMHHAVTHHSHSALLPIAALLIFCGTIGKSAQVPLHVWLPNAMEGPTPVSALIHAATMVAAGVFLVARSFILLEVFPEVMPVITWVGVITALLAATIALTATDIKKVLAYSTISQLGFMVAAMGLGAMLAGIFHLMTHAFFKALLFLGAGSVIHGTGTQDIRKMGGLFNKMKSTAWTFLIASVAIAGVPPLAGFWSKDEILVAAGHSNMPWAYYILSLAAFMTAFYMFRLFILTFLGKARDEKIHAHESPASMTVPLWILAIGSALIGLPGSPLFHFWLQNFWHGAHGHVEHVMDYKIMISSTLIGLGGIALAWFLYKDGLAKAEKLAPKWGLLRKLSLNKFWFDEIYAAVLVKPFHALGRYLYFFDATIVDGLVNSTRGFTFKGGRAHQFIDTYIVDAIVNLTGKITHLFSGGLRLLQTGLVQNYILIVFTGVVICLYFGVR